MPDLNPGQTLVAFGRYRGDGPGAVRIAGTLPGERREFADDVTFTANDTRHAFIPRLWATRRVGWLLDEIRLRGESKVLKDEVVRLAREHGIVTPYTAYLILEDEARRNVPVASRTFQDLEADRLALGTVAGQYASARGAGGPSAGAGMGGYSGAPAEAAAAPEKAGPRAVQNAQAAQRMKEAQTLGDSSMDLAMKRQRIDPSVPALPAAGGVPTTQPSEGYYAKDSYAQQVKVVNGRAFYQNGATWTDATAQSKQNLKRQDVKFNSEDYFALVSKYPSAAQWLSLGSEVDVVIGDTLYQVR
jgi:Ca-activated chloride channel family protein